MNGAAHAWGAGLAAVVGTVATLSAVRAAVGARGARPRGDLGGRASTSRVDVAAVVLDAAERVTGELSVRRAAPVLAGAALSAFVVGNSGPLLVAGGVVLATVVVRVAFARRAERSFARGLVPALDGAVAGLRGGLGLRDALVSGCAGAGGVVASDGRVMQRRLARGETFEEALGWWVTRRPGDDLALVASIVGVAHRLGGPTVTVLEEVVDVLRARRQVDDEIAAHASQAVASAVLLAALPLLALGLVSLSDPAVPAWLLGTGGGLLCVSAGVVLEVLGVVWMVAIVGGVR